MSAIDRPFVLIVDDEPDDQQAAFPRGPEAPARFEPVHPDDVDEDLLGKADLVLVDLRLENWPARNGVASLWGRPLNGLALASVLREHAIRLGHTTGFALRSGHLSDISVSPAEPRAHAVARTHNLEWVFSKVPEFSDDSTIRQTAILATAIRQLPEEWYPDDRGVTETRVIGLLALPDGVAWKAIALHDVYGCRPPLTELSRKNHGLLFLRWLLQRIFPYPCFLLDTHRLAARLRTSQLSLVEALKGKLGELFSNVRYAGIAAGFAGEQWWRAGIEDVLWELTEGNSLPVSELRNVLSKITGANLVSSASDNPVVAVDENYRPLPDSCPANEVVRIQPDDWPVFASQAWTTVNLARKHARLRSVVVSEDLERVDELETLGSETEDRRE